MIVINYNILHRIGGFKCMYDVNRSNIKKKKKTSSTKHNIFKKQNHTKLLICNFIIKHFFFKLFVFVRGL